MQPRSGWIITGRIQKNILRSYEWVITPFCRDRGNRELEELTVDLVQTFLESITNGRKPQTRKIRFAHLTSFFNYVHNNLSPDFQNPCNSPMLRKLFRHRCKTSEDRIFPISYETTRMMVALTQDYTHTYLQYSLFEV